MGKYNITPEMKRAIESRVGRSLSDTELEAAIASPGVAASIEAAGGQVRGSMLGETPGVSYEGPGTDSREYGGGPPEAYDTPPPTDTEPTDTGSLGAWGTAMMAVAKTVPSIIEASQNRRPLAPAANIGGRRAFDVPNVASTFGKNDPGFQSLLARLLMGR